MSSVANKSYSLSAVRGLSSSEVAVLRRAGIDTTAELLAATKTHYSEQKLARSTGLSLYRMREAVNRADLVRLSGMGPVGADLFENAGVNSVKELAQRNAESLYKALQAYDAKHPELNYRLPSPATVASLVAKAKQAVAPAAPTSAPVSTFDAAAKVAAPALHKHIDEVLFSNHPDGASFREAILAWRPSSEWEQVRARMHADVDKFLTDAERVDSPDKFIFAGPWMGLYSEIKIHKADGKHDPVFVEID